MFNFSIICWSEWHLSNIRVTPLATQARIKQLCWQLSVQKPERGTERRRSSTMILLRVFLCFYVTDTETERHSLLTQASHYVGCNLSFRGPVRPSDCTEWGVKHWPPLSFLCFHSAYLCNSDYSLTEWVFGQWGGEVGRVCVCALGGRGTRGFGRPVGRVGTQCVMEGFIWDLL